MTHQSSQLPICKRPLKNQMGYVLMICPVSKVWKKIWQILAQVLNAINSTEIDALWEWPLPWPLANQWYWDKNDNIFNESKGNKRFPSQGMTIFLNKGDLTQRYKRQLPSKNQTKGVFFFAVIYFDVNDDFLEKQ